jgi:hypothetical protein
VAGGIDGGAVPREVVGAGLAGAVVLGAGDGLAVRLDRLAAGEDVDGRAVEGVGVGRAVGVGAGLLAGVCAGAGAGSEAGVGRRIR